jgi:tetratricopeptide (TPR) repeat protein
MNWGGRSGRRREAVAITEAVLGAETSAAWREVILRFEARVADDPALAAAVMECAEDLERHGRQDDAQILRRWHTTVQRRVLEQRMMAAVPDADDAELDELVRRVPSMATPENVEQGLAAVRELSRRDAPTSPRTQADAARPILGFCLRIAKRLDRPDLIARTLMQRAWLAMRVDEPAPALADLQAAAAEWQSAGNAVDEARCLSMAGDALLALDRPADAAERMREAVRLLEGSDEHVLLAATYDDLWAISDRGGEKEAALAYLELGAFHRIAAGQAERAVPMLGAVIGTRLAHDDTSRALPAAERLVDLWEQRPDLLDPRAGDMIELILQTTALLAAEGHAETFLLLQAEAGHPVENGYRSFVDPEKLAAARRWYALAERAGRLAPSEEKEAWLAYFDALLSRHTGDLERVVRRATEALPFFDANDHHVQSIGLREAIYEAEGERGELARAVAWCDDVLARLDAYGDDADGDSGYRASCLMRRGQYLLNLGRPQAALDDLNDALRLIRADPDAALSRANEGPALALLAAIHEYLGDLRAALEADRDALLVARRINHRRGEAHQLASLGALVGKVATGWLRARLSHADAELMAQVALQADPSLADAGVLEPAEIAAALLGRAAQLFAEINDTAGWTVAAVNLCNLLPDDEGDRKVELLSELVQAKAAVGDRLGQAVALANLGAAHKRLGHTEEAVRAWKESLTISRPAGYFQSAAQAARDLAGLRRDLGDAKAAEAGYREAVQMIEAARSQLPLEDRARVGFVRNKGGAYTNLVDLLVAREAHDEAFEMVQRAKSRALLDFAGTGEVRPTITPRGRAAELFDEERRCLTRLRGARPSGDTVEGAAATMARLDALYGELAVFDPEYVAMRRGTPATVAELRTWLRAQGRPVLLVEYFLSDGWLTLFFLRAEWEHVRVRRLACTPDEIAFGYDDFLHDVVRYRNHSGAGWTRLARLLTEPLAEHLRPGDLVYLIPHRRLHSLPLHALPLDDDPLIAGHPVVYAPTSGLLPLSQNAARGTGKLESCASFGVVFEEEAREVAALFGAEAIGPHELHSEVVEELCAGKDVCHFSCHGYFNPTTPMLSGLVLQPNGKTPERQELLTAQRVMSMRLRTGLVCISACESASSEIGEGDELLGLIRAFLHAGASSLVASLWAVDADSTRDLMVAFYQRLLEGYKRDGTIAKADALRGAQLQLMEEVGAGSSFYWAPFALVGNWR